VTETDLLSWAIVQEGRLAAALPWILMGAFVGVGVLVSAARAMIGFGEREMGIALVGIFLLVAGAFWAHVLSPGGTVAIEADDLVVDRRFRPTIQMPLQGIEVTPMAWTAQGAQVSSSLAAGIQLELASGGRSLTIGASGAELSRRAVDSSLSAVRRPPQVVLSEKDFVQLLEVLWSS
jgi:hypothetical protein